MTRRDIIRDFLETDYFKGGCVPRHQQNNRYIGMASHLWGAFCFFEEVYYVIRFRLDRLVCQGQKYLA